MEALRQKNLIFFIACLPFVFLGLVSCSGGGRGGSSVGSSDFGVSVVRIQGNNQIAHAKKEYALPLTVEVTSPTGDPIPNIPVEFSETSTTGAQILTPAGVSGSDGKVSTYVVAPNDYDEDVTIQAEVQGSSNAADFSLTTSVPVATVQFVPGFAPPATYTADAVVPMSTFKVEMFDSSGTLIAINNPKDWINLTLSTGTGQLLGTVKGNFVDGIATFSDIRDVRAENVVLRATHNKSGIYAQQAIKILPNPATQTIAVLPGQTYLGGALTLAGAVTGTPTTYTADDTFTVDVKAVDQYFNVDPTYSGAISVSTPNDPTDTEPGGTVFAAGDANFTISPVTAANAQVVRLSSALGTNNNSSLYDIKPGAAKNLIVKLPGQNFNPGQTSLVNAITSAPSVETAGATFAATVYLTDSEFNVVTTATSSVKLTTSDTADTDPSPMNLAAGVATFNVTNVTAASGETVTPSETGYASNTSTAYSVQHAKASKIVYTTQPASPTVAGAEIAPVLTIEDAYGNVVNSGVDATANVSLSLGQGTGTLGGTTSMAAVAGVADFTGKGVNIDKVGNNKILRATKADTSGSGGTPSISVDSGTFQIIPAPPNHFVLTGNASAAAGTCQAYVLQTQDVYGNVSGMTAGTTVTFSGNGNGTFYSDACVTPLAANQTTMSTGTSSVTVYLKDTKAESLTLGADDGAGGLTAAALAVTVTPGSLDHFLVAGIPSPVVVGTASSVSIIVQDAYDNTVTSYLGTIHFTSDDTGATLPADYKFVSGDDGTHIFTNGVTLTVTGTHYVRVADTVDPTKTGEQAGIQVNPGPIDHFGVTGIATPEAAGTISSVTVSAYDSHNNLKTDYTGTIHFTSDDLIAALPVDYSFVAADSGVHTFTNGVTLKTSGTHQVSVNDTFYVTKFGLEAGIVVNPAAASQLAFTVEPVNSTAGVDITPAIQVSVEDPYGNLVTSSSANVALALSADPSGGAATLGGTLTVAAASGVAKFSNININKAFAGYALSASSTGLTAATSNAFDIAPNSPTHLAYNRQPSNVASGTAISPAITVQILDAYNNLVTSSSAGVTLAFNTDPTGGATLSGTLTQTAASGVATFNDITVDKSGTGFKLNAASSGLTSAVSAAFNVTPGPPTHLAFIQEPSNAVDGIAISPAIKVEILDAHNNVVTSSSVNVSLAFGTDPTGGVATLSGTLTQAAVAGVASFNDISIDKTGTAFTLAASSAALTAATSSTFNITPGAPTHLTFGQQPSNTDADSKIAPAVTVQILDSNNNIVTSSAANVTLSFNTDPTSGAATLSGTLTVAAASGVATFGNININKVGTGFKLAASSTSLTSAVSSAFNIMPGAPTHLAFNQQPTSAASATAISPAMTVEILDANNNLVTGSSANVTLAIGTDPSGAATLSGTLTQAAASGVATFNDISLDKAGTGFKLAASSTWLTSTISSAFNITPGAPTHLAFVQEPTNAVDGAAIAPAIKVEILDANNNLTTSTANVTLAFNTDPTGGVATLSGTLTVAAVSGIATFSDINIDKTGSGFKLDASSAGLTTATSSAFDITPGTPTHLAYKQQPTNAVSGAAISPAITVDILDVNNNIVTTSTANVTLAFNTDPTGGVATLSGTLTVAAVSGVATFSNINIDKTGSGFKLDASSAGLTTATSSAFNITPGSPTHLAYNQQPTSAVSGAAISPAITVDILDANNNIVTTSTANVTLSFNTDPTGGAATLAGTLTVAATSGVATFNNININKTGSGFKLDATSAGLTTATSTAFNITPGAPTHLAFNQGPSNTIDGVAIAPAITIQILDSNNNIVTSSTANVTLAFNTDPTGGAATLSGTLTVAAAGGVATFANISINKTGTGFKFDATSAGLTTATSSAFNITPGTPTHLAYVQQPTSTTAGAVIGPAITVEVLDANNNIVTTSSANVTVAFNNDPTGSATLSGTLTQAAASGVATFNDISINKTGSGFKLAAASAGLTSATSSAFNVSPGTLDHFLVGGITNPFTAGNTSDVTVTAYDADNNIKTDYAGTVVFSSSDGVATVPANYTFVVTDNGTHTFASGVILKTAGTQYVKVADSVDATKTGQQSGITVKPAADNYLLFTQEPTDATSGAAIVPAMTVSIYDAYNNLTASTATVILAFNTDPTGGAAILSGPLSVSAVNGVATFNNISIDKVGNGFKLDAKSTGLTTATSSAFNITPGAPTHLAYNQEPTNAVSGASIAPAITVQILDANNNIVMSSSANVTLAFNTDPTGGAATLSGTLTVAAVNGVATFNNISVDKAGTGFKLDATASGLTSATSAAFNITPGAPTHLVFAQEPVNATAGEVMNPAMTVRILDANDNLVTGSSANVTLSIKTDPSGAATLSGTLTRAAVNGVATFNDISIDKVGVGYVLTAASAGLTSVDSTSFNVNSGVPTHVAFNQQPTNAISGAAIAPAITVQILDASNNVVSSSSADVTLSFNTDPTGGAATLSGTLSMAAVNGVATFNNISIDKVGTGFKFDATSTGLTSATSTAFNITPGAATHLAYNQEPTNAVSGASIAPAITVQILDANNNVVTGSSANVTLAFNTDPSGAATLSGTLTVAAVNGVATFNNISIDKAASGYKLDAQSTGLTTATSTAFNITPGAPTHLAYNQQPTNTVSGAAISPAITVDILDANNNVVTGSTANVTLAFNTDPSGAATLSGTLTVAAVSGVATFNGINIDKAGTGFKLDATSTGLTAATSNAFNVAPGTPTHLAYNQQPTNVISGASIAPAITVDILDANNNIVTGSTANVTLSFNTDPTGSATLTGTLTVAAVSGIATFNNISIDKAASGYKLDAKSTGLTTATSNAFNVTPGAATHLVYNQQPTSAVSGATISPAITVQILDANNNLTSSTANVTLAFNTDPSGAATLSGTLTVAAVSGIATFNNISIDKAGTGFKLDAKSTGLTAATSSAFNITPGAATHLAYNQQPTNATSGAAIAPAITVQILDANNNVVTSSSANVALSFNTDPSGAATLSGTLTVAAVSGFATFNNISIDKAGTGFKLDAKSAGLTAATSNAFNITPGAATHLAYNQQPTNVVSGASISPAITVQILDANNNVVTSSSANVTLAFNTDPSGAATLSGTLTVAAVSGVATFNNISIDKAVSGYKLDAKSTGLTTATSNPFNVTPGAATHLAYNQQPTNAISGVTISPAITVQILDANNNVVTSSSANVTLAFSTDPSGAATLSGTLTVAAVSGVATFNNISIDKAVSGYKLDAKSTGLTTATSNAFNVTPGAATHLAYNQQPTNAVSGAAISPAITVQILDANNNVVTSSSANVTLAFNTDPSGAATLSGTLTVAAANGVATFNNISIDKAASGYKLDAKSTGLTSATSNAFNITPGAPTHLTYNQQPTNAVSGTSISPAITVDILDANDNVVTSSSANVTLAFNSDPSGAATLSGTLTIVAANGVATFSNISIDKAATGFKLDATSTGLTTATSNAFNITPGAPTHLAYSQQPTNVVSGTSISPAIMVQILDANNNIVTGSSANVTLAFNTDPSGAATLSGTLTVAAVAGVATFSNISIDKSGTGFKLDATSTGLTTATSSAFNVAPGAATHLAYSQQPTNTVSATAISPAITVDILDANNNIVTSSLVNVTLSFNTDPSGAATLSGTLMVAAVNGVATFNDINIDKAGSGYKLDAKSTGLTTATSNAFNITPGAATHLVYNQQPTNAVSGAAISPAITVQILDADNNLTTSTANVTLAFNTDPSGAATLSGTLTVAAVAGVATFNNISIDKAGTGFKLDAKSTGLTAATSNAFNITPGAATHLAFNQQPSNATDGVAISPAMTVQILDANNNLVSSTANVTLAFNTDPSGSATLSGTLTVAAVAGVATFNNISINKTGTGFKLDATSTGLTTATSSVFNITPAALDHFTLTGVSNPFTAGSSSNVTVTAYDANNNIKTDYTGTAVFSSSDAAATLPANYTFVVGDSGSHTFASGVILKTAGTQDVKVADLVDGTKTGQQSNITVNPAADNDLSFTQEPSNATDGVAISPAMTVGIYDAYNNRTSSTANVTLSFNTDPSGSATLNGTLTVAAVNGVATFNNININKTGTGFKLDATSTGLTTATSTAFNITPGAATHLAYNQQPTNAVSTVAINPAITVEILDANNNVVTGNSASVTLSFNTDPTGAATLSGTLTVAAVNGVATFNDISIDKAGTGFKLDAKSTGLTTATSNAFNITPGAASHLAYNQQPTNAVSGAAISPAIAIQILDANNNVVSGSSASVTLSFNTDPTGTATLSGTLTVAAVNGVATFNNISIDKAGTGFKLDAKSTGLTTATSNAFNVTPGAATHLAYNQQPTNAVSGAAISPSITVQILDANNNLTSSTANVTLAFNTDPSGSATLSGTLTVAAVNGVATFNNISIDKAGTGFKLDATSTGLTTATSSAFDITPGAATHLAYSQQPTNTVSATAISPAITVDILDANNNIATGSSANVTLSFNTDPTGAATLSGTLTVAAVSGVATFSNIGIDKAGTGFKLDAKSTGLTTATSNAFNITPGTPTHLAYNQEPTNAVSGAAISPSITVQILDANNNLTTSTANVTLSFNTDPSGSATLSGTLTVAAVSGVATFNNISIDKAGTGFKLDAKSTGLTTATSSAFNIKPGAATHLTYNQQPTNAVSGAAISPSITVQILDANNNLTTSTANVTLSFNTDPTGTATLSGTLTVAAVSGVATFNNISIDKTGTGFKLDAKSTGLTTATSSAFNITPGAATHLTYNQQPTNAVSGAAISPAITVEILDANNNLTTSTANVTLSFNTDPTGTATLSGTLTVAAVSGVATFNNISIDKAGTGFKLDAKSTGLTTATSNAFNITAGAATHLAFNQEPTNAVSATVISPAMTVQILDANNNLTSSTANVTLAFNTDPSGSATLTGTLTVAAVAGVATFNNISVNKTGIGFKLDATSTGLTTVTSSAFNVTPAAIDHFTVTGVTDPFTAGNSSNVTVTAYDAQNNVKTDYRGTVVFSSGDASATLPANYAFVSGDSGSHTFASGVILKTAGSQYVKVVDSVVGTATGQQTVTVNPAADNYLSFSQEPTNAVDGTSISPAITVSIYDAYNNLTTSTANVTLSFNSDPSGTATLSGTLTVAAVNGVATFNNISINKTGTGFKLGAAETGVTSAVSTAFNITSGPLDHFTVTGVTDPFTAGNNSNVTVTAYDANNNIKTDYTGTVVFSTGDVSGTVPANYAFVSGDRGSHTFASGVILKTAGSQYVKVVDSVVGTATGQQTVSVNPAADNYLSFSQQPTNAVDGTSISPAITVSIYDAYNNLTISTANVTLLFNTDPSGTATLSGTLTVAAVNGVATFNNISINKTGTGFKLGAAETGVTSAVSAAFNITPGAATHVAFVQEPTATVQNTVMSPSLTVAVMDANNNIVTSSSANVTLSIQTDPSGSATLSGTLTQAAVSGVATFNDLSIDNIGTGYVLAAASAGLTSGLSSSFNITACVPDHLVIQPLDGSGNPTTSETSAAAFAVKVTAVDATNATKTCYRGSQSISWTMNGTTATTLYCGASSGAPTAPSDTTLTFTNGVATTSTSAIFTVAESTATVAATIGSIAGTSSSLTIAAGGVCHIALRSAAAGGGSVVTSSTINLDAKATLYAAGYDEYANYNSDVVVTWSGSGGVYPSPQLGNSSNNSSYADVVGVKITSTGVIQADYAGGGGEKTATDNVTVNAGSNAVDNWTTATSDNDGVNTHNLLGSNTTDKVFYWDPTVGSPTWLTAGTQSWYTEPFTANSRGSRLEFPERVMLVGNSNGLDIIDATNNHLWMRFTSAAANAIDPTYGSIVDVTALDGKIYVGMRNGTTTGALIILDMKNDKIYRVDSTGGYVLSGNIAARNSGANTWSASTSYPALSSGKVYSLSSRTIGTEDYVLVGTSASAELLEDTGTPPAKIYKENDSTAVISNPVTGVYIATDGKLYIAENTVGVHRVDATLPLSANYTAFAATYSQTSTAKLPSLTLNSLTVSEGTSKTTSGLNTVLVGTAQGLAAIQESTGGATDTSHVYTTAETSTRGTGFSGFAGLGGGSSCITPSTTPTTTSARTIEMFFQPSVTINSTNNGFYLVNGGPAGNGNYSVYFNSLGQLEFDTNGSGSIHRAMTTETSWTAGKWYHLVVVVDMSTRNMNIYINGVSDGATRARWSYAASTGTVSIGCNGSSRGFPGNIDEFHLFETVNPFSYNGGTAAVPTAPYTGGTYEYHFDGDSSTIVAGSDPSTINGAMSGPVWLASDKLAGTSNNVSGVDIYTVGTAGTAEVGTNGTGGAWSEITDIEDPLSAALNASLTGLDISDLKAYQQDSLTNMDLFMGLTSGGVELDRR